MQRAVSEAQAAAESRYTDYFLPRARPEILDEIWDQYVREHMSAELLHYADLTPSAGELDLWLEDLRCRTLTSFAGREVSTTIDQHIHQWREAMKAEAAKPRQLELYAQNLRRLKKRVPLTLSELAKETALTKRQILTHLRGTKRPRPTAIRQYARVFSDALGIPICGEDITEKDFSAFFLKGHR